MSNNSHPTPLHSFDPSVLIGLMQEIRGGFAQLQVITERHSNTERRLADSEERAAEALKSLEQQVLRVHQRLDEMQNTMREEVSSVREEVRQFTEGHRAETLRQITSAVEPVAKRTDEAAKAASDVRKDFDGWVNRGKGAWFVASICAGIFQACIVGALLWAMGEVKTLHDWRIQVEAQRPPEQRAIPK